MNDDDLEFSELKQSVFFFGEILSKRRKALSLTQEDLSKLAGVSRSTISLIEREEPVNIDSIKKVIFAMDKYKLLSKTPIAANRHRVSS